MSVVQEELAALFSDRFGGDAALLVTSPGRSEIAGNHTDHEGGHVIAAAIDRAVRGLFRANGTQTITLLSQGFGEVSVELDDLSARADERNSTAALVRGMAALFAEKGFAPVGFDAACVSEVLGGSGLSSSAAFELSEAEMV